MAKAKVDTKVVEVKEVAPVPTVEERAANAADPLGNPLPSSTFIVTPGEPSRLPAGSTLLVEGVHVAHPHAEVNLAGAGDTRLGETDAVTEEIRHGEIFQRPLDQAVKPQVVTIAKNLEVVKAPVTFEPSSPVAAKPVDELRTVAGETLGGTE